MALGVGRVRQCWFGSMVGIPRGRGHVGRLCRALAVLRQWLRGFNGTKTLGVLLLIGGDHKLEVLIPYWKENNN